MRNEKQEFRSKMQGARSSAIRRGFSLVEVLLAMFILGIGMIMVASVFPVGANWTRETTEESVAQTVVQDALTVLRTHYGPGGNLRNYMRGDYLTNDPTSGAVIPNGRIYNINGTNFNTILQIQDDVSMEIDKAIINVPGAFVVQSLPGFWVIPPEERAYQFGSSKPFPAVNWKQCTYFWTALARLNPIHRNVGWDRTTANTSTPPDYTNGIVPSSSYSYDIFVLVFRKGSVDQVFTSNGWTGNKEVSNTRITPSSPEQRLVSMPSNNPASLVPSVAMRNYIPGAYAGGGNWSTSALPMIGQMGIGAISGTVFKQALSENFKNADPRPELIRDPKGTYPDNVVEPVIYSPPADGTNASPLIYIYQTTMTF